MIFLAHLGMRQLSIGTVNAASSKRVSAEKQRTGTESARWFSHSISIRAFPANARLLSCVRFRLQEAKYILKMKPIEHG
jgi:hypothetical protein